MCHLCDMRKDLRIVSTLAMLLPVVDFGKTKASLAMTTVDLSILLRALKPLDDGLQGIDLSEIFSDEDEQAYKVKTLMIALNILEECCDQLEQLFEERGGHIPIILTESDSEVPTAFADVIDEIIERLDGKEQGHE